MNGRYYEAEYGTPGPTDNLTPDARQRYRKGSLDTRYAGIMGEKGTFTVNMYGDMTNMQDKTQSGLTYTLDDRKLGLKADTTFSESEGLWDLRIGGYRNGTISTIRWRRGIIASRNGLSSQYDRRFRTAHRDAGPSRGLDERFWVQSRPFHRAGLGGNPEVPD